MIQIMISKYNNILTKNNKRNKKIINKDNYKYNSS